MVTVMWFGRKHRAGRCRWRLRYHAAFDEVCRHHRGRQSSVIHHWRPDWLARWATWHRDVPTRGHPRARPDRSNLVASGSWVIRVVFHAALWQRATDFR